MKPNTLLPPDPQGVLVQFAVLVATSATILGASLLGCGGTTSRFSRLPVQPAMGAAPLVPQGGGPMPDLPPEANDPWSALTLVAAESNGQAGRVVLARASSRGGSVSWSGSVPALLPPESTDPLLSATSAPRFVAIEASHPGWTGVTEPVFRVSVVIDGRSQTLSVVRPEREMDLGRPRFVVPLESLLGGSLFNGAAGVRWRWSLENALAVGTLESEFTTPTPLLAVQSRLRPGGGVRSSGDLERLRQEALGAGRSILEDEVVNPLLRPLDLWVRVRTDRLMLWSGVEDVTVETSLSGAVSYRDRRLSVRMASLSVPGFRYVTRFDAGGEDAAALSAPEAHWTRIPLAPRARVSILYQARAAQGVSSCGLPPSQWLSNPGVPPTLQRVWSFDAIVLAGGFERELRVTTPGEMPSPRAPLLAGPAALGAESMPSVVFESWSPTGVSAQQLQSRSVDASCPDGVL